jgi:hypothetical protein
MHYGMPLSAQAAPVDTGPGKPVLLTSECTSRDARKTPLAAAAIQCRRSARFRVSAWSSVPRRTGLPAAVASAGDGWRVVSLLVMVGGFDVGRAVGAGLGDRRRVLEFIDGFAAAWTRPLAREDGYGEDVLQSVEEHLGVRLPAALREAYLVLGKRRDLTARQDPLLPLERLRVDQTGEVIVFRRENQGCAEWGVAAADPWNPEDPPVYVRQPGDRPWEPFATRMSLACADLVLSEVLLGAQFMAMCDLSGVAGRSCRGDGVPAGRSAGVPAVVRHRRHQPLVRRTRETAAHGRAGTFLLAGRSRADSQRP